MDAPRLTASLARKPDTAVFRMRHSRPMFPSAPRRARTSEPPLLSAAPPLGDYGGLEARPRGRHFRAARQTNSAGTPAFRTRLKPSGSPSRSCAASLLFARPQQTGVMALHRFVALTGAVLQRFRIDDVDFPADVLDETGSLQGNRAPPPTSRPGLRLPRSSRRRPCSLTDLSRFLGGSVRELTIAFAVVLHPSAHD
jgi:hypothetical protein